MRYYILHVCIYLKNAHDLLCKKKRSKPSILEFVTRGILLTWIGKKLHLFFSSCLRLLLNAPDERENVANERKPLMCYVIKSEIFLIFRYMHSRKRNNWSLTISLRNMLTSILVFQRTHNTHTHHLTISFFFPTC